MKHFNFIIFLCSVGYIAAFKTGCGQADIVFMLDESNSIWQEDLNKGKQFISSIIDYLGECISPDSCQVGMISFADYAFVRFNLKKFKNKKDLQDTLLHQGRLVGETTETDQALSLLRSSLFDSSFGARKNVMKLAVLITDGGSTVPYRTKQQADLLHHKDVSVFAVGVAQSRNILNTTELRFIASKPEHHFSFTVEDWESLQGLKEVLASRACPVKTEITTLKSQRNRRHLRWDSSTFQNKFIQHDMCHLY